MVADYQKAPIEVAVRKPERNVTWRRSSEVAQTDVRQRREALDQQQEDGFKRSQDGSPPMLPA
jgi:hypothetical protein